MSSKAAQAGNRWQQDLRDLTSLGHQGTARALQLPCATFRTWSFVPFVVARLEGQAQPQLAPSTHAKGRILSIFHAMPYGPSMVLASGDANSAGKFALQHYLSS